MIPWLVLVTHGLAQFAAHFTGEWTDRTFGNGWAQLFKYMTGVMVAAPFLHLLMWAFEIPKRIRRVVMLLFFADFFSGALGSLAGWVVMPTPNHNHNNGAVKHGTTK